MLKVSLFGTPRITLNDSAVKISRRKAMALFCYLVTRTQPIARDTLAAFLWSDLDQERARADLRVSLWAINKAIGDDWLIVDRDTIQINPDKPFWLDLVAFQEAIQAPLTHQHHPDELCTACLPHYEAAYALYSDDFLAGFSMANAPEFEDWQLMEAESLRLTYQQALQKLIIGHSALQELEKGMQYAQRWLALDPFNEEAYRAVMALYAWSGNKTSALQQYHACEQVLSDELDVPPSDKTLRLYQDIKAGILPDLPTIYYDDALPSVPHNLPPQPNPFRGRGAEVAQLTDNLKNADCRLLTITGLGGAGKTRLALHTARQMLSDFPDGVFFVSLAGATNAFSIMTDIADQIGFQFESKEALNAQLLSYLAPKTMLLILDNFEHLVAHVGFIEQILQHAPQVKLIVTSRIPLNLKAEWVFTLDRMTEGAEQLFMDSASRVERSFSPDNIDGIHAICERLAGVPLAIELAATWVRVLSVDQILDEVQHNKEALETDWHDIPERQRSLQATFDYSWQLLNDTNRQALARLAIFPASFNHDAAKVVCEVRLSALSALAAQALIKRNAQGRYELHALIREFALAKLRENPADYPTTMAAFIRYFSRLLADHRAMFHSEKMLTAKSALLQEIDSIRAACDLSVRIEQADWMVDGLTSLAILYDLQGWYEEGKAVFEAFSRAVPRSALLNLRSKLFGGRFLRLTGDYERAERVLLDTVAQADDYPEDMASGYVQLSYVAYNQNPEQAFQYAQKALDIYDELGYSLYQGSVLRTMAEIHAAAGRIDEGTQTARKALDILLQHGKTLELPPTYRILSRFMMYQGKYDEAIAYGETAVDLYRELNLKDQLIRAQTALAGVQNRVGRYDAAQTLLKEAIVLADHLQFEESLTYALMEYGTNSYYRKDYYAAVDALERALILSKKLKLDIITSYLKLNLSNVLVDLQVYDRAQTTLLSALPDLERAGNTYGIVIATYMLGKCYIATGQFDQAHAVLHRSIDLAGANQMVGDWLTAICYLGLLHYHQADYPRALQLIAFVIAHESTESVIREEAVTYREKITLALGQERARSLLRDAQPFDIQAYLRGD